MPRENGGAEGQGQSSGCWILMLRKGSDAMQREDSSSGNEK